MATVSYYDVSNHIYNVNRSRVKDVNTWVMSTNKIAILSQKNAVPIEYEYEFEYEVTDMVFYLRTYTLSIVECNTQIARFMGPAWRPPGSCQPQMGPMLASKLHPCRHCLHTRTWIRILNYFLIFRCKHGQHARHRSHVNMACNPWLETWDVAHWGNKDLCHCPMDYCWPHDIVPSRIKSNLNCRCQLTCDDWGIPNTKPNYCQCTSAALLCNYHWQVFTIRTSTNEIWCLDFDSPGCVT